MNLKIACRPLWKIPLFSLFQSLCKHCCFQFLLGLTMVPRKNKSNAFAKFGGTNKEYYGLFQSGLFKATRLAASIL